MKIVSFSF